MTPHHILYSPSIPKKTEEKRKRRNSGATTFNACNSKKKKEKKLGGKWAATTGGDWEVKVWETGRGAMTRVTEHKLDSEEWAQAAIGWQS